MVDEDGLVVDEQHVVEMIIRRNHGACFPACRVDQRQRGADGIAKPVVMIAVPVEAAGVRFALALGEQRAIS
jgi:hypothetical protein